MYQVIYTNYQIIAEGIVQHIEGKM
jgi:hypothetical protein